MEGLKQDVTTILGKEPNIWVGNSKVLIPTGIPLSECLPCLDRHRIMLKAVTDTLPDNEFVAITSTSIDYTGKKRTTSNGLNHVKNKGLDFIVVEKTAEGIFLTQRSFPYSRSTLVIIMVAIAVSKGYVGRVCLEDDHIHVHHSHVFSGVLQMVSDKNRHNTNTNFLCASAHSSYLHIDITSFTKLIAKQNFS